MSSDYKYDIYLKAEEIAEEEYGKGYYDLTDEQQLEVFDRAMRIDYDRMLDRADQLKDQRQEDQLK